MAAHCCEELVMLKPTSCIYHNRLADVYYSMGGEDNLRLARKHYTMSLNYQAPEINVQALYGLRASAEMLVEVGGNDKAVAKSTEKSAGDATDTNAASDVEVNKELSLRETSSAWGSPNLRVEPPGEYIH